MTEVIGVRFKDKGKAYTFATGGAKVPVGSKVVVETSRGTECGDVVEGARLVDESRMATPLKTIIRPATEKDLRTLEQNRQKEINAFKACEERILKHKLDMKLVDVECAFDNSKLLFYFTADNRVDFRELVKDLAGMFRMRIELRQIGVRDEAKMLGGLGVCGRPFCCKTFLTEFQPVSIKMAKDQGLSLNPTKISGTCGRLMCCLKYEQDFYEQEYKTTPKPGSLVSTPEFRGYVEEVNLITGKIRVKPEKSDDPAQIFDKKDVHMIREGRHDKDDKNMKNLKKLE